MKDTNFGILFSILTLCLCPCHGTAEKEEPKGAKPEDKIVDTREFKLTVVVLTMNRAHSLARLLRSLDATDFEFKEDYFDVEIHVDKSIGAHYDDCVK